MQASARWGPSGGRRDNPGRCLQPGNVMIFMSVGTSSDVEQGLATEPKQGDPRDAALTALATRASVVSFPSVLTTNPYQRLLYEHLAAHGIDLVPDGEFTIRWLISARGRVRYLHFHWQEGHYRVQRQLRPRALWWVKLGIFGARLTAARMMRFRIVWTIHQVVPHESSGRMLDHAAALLLSRAAHVLMTHDRATAEAARRQLRLGNRTIGVVPIGSYAGIYPPGRDRAIVRADLGIAPDTFAFICFGGLRAYKDVDLLLDAFEAIGRPDVALVLAGPVTDPREFARLTARAARDPRVITRFEHVPDDQVTELFDACDAAVFPRGDGGTSSSLILALSLGCPAVVVDAPSYMELTGGEEGGWVFEAGDQESLRGALVVAAQDADTARARGRAAALRAERLSWDETGSLTAMFIGGAVTSDAASPA